MRYDYQAAFSNLTAHTFNSGMPHTGSSAAFVSLFAAASAKWNGMNTVPSTAFGDTAIFATMLPRREATEIFSPSPNPYLTASAGEILDKTFGRTIIPSLLRGIVPVSAGDQKYIRCFKIGKTLPRWKEEGS